MGTQIHACHVQIRTEEGNLSLLVPICFKPFEDALGIMEHRRARVKRQRPIWGTGEKGVLVVNCQRDGSKCGTYKA
jgi:hypothetical protein